MCHQLDKVKPHLQGIGWTCNFSGQIPDKVQQASLKIKYYLNWMLIWWEFMVCILTKEPVKVGEDEILIRPESYISVAGVIQTIICVEYGVTRCHLVWA